MAKPLTFFTHSTDINFAGGPAVGLPTKVVIPSAAQGFIPGDDLLPEYFNDILNLTGQYTSWMFDGSSAGAADAHIVETNASGDTALQSVSLAADVAFSNTAIEHNVSGPPKAPGNGVQDGLDLVIQGTDGQDQVGATNNNAGGNIRRTPGRAGGGGTLLEGGMGFLHLRGSNVTGSSDATGFYEGVAGMVVPALGFRQAITGTFIGTNRVGLVQVDWSLRDGGGGVANTQSGSRRWHMVSDGAGALTFVDAVVVGELSAPEFVIGTGLGAGALVATIGLTTVAGGSRLAITVQENSNIGILITMHVKILLS